MTRRNPTLLFSILMVFLTVSALILGYSEALKLRKQAKSSSRSNRFSNLPLDDFDVFTKPSMRSMEDADCPYTPTPYPLEMDHPQWKQLLNNVSKLLDSQFNTTRYESNSLQITAASAIITYRNKIVLEWNAGVDTRTGMRPTRDTVYRIGSISKIFPVYLGLIAESRGFMSMNDPVKKYVPELEMIDNFHTEQSGRKNMFTFHNLASHLAGVPREAPCTLIGCNLTSSEMLQRMKSMYLILPPFIRPSYSNLGLAMLGRFVAERVLKGNYEDVVKQLILDPLGMKRTFFNGKNYVIPPVPLQPLYSLDWIAPSGQMYSTVGDLAAFAMAVTQAYVTPYTFSTPAHPQNPHNHEVSSPDLGYGGQPVLGIPSSIVRQYLDPVFGNEDNTGMGAPWEIEVLGPYYVRHKSGNINGYSANVALIPELQLSMIIATNYHTDAIDWAQHNLNYLVPRLENLLWPLQAPPPTPTEVWRYVGNYTPGVVIGVNAYEQLAFTMFDGEPTDVPLVISPSNPSNPSVLQIYIPFGDSPCLLEELYTLGYQTVEFRLDGATGKAIGFKMPGVSYTGLWLKTG